jgi:hypothetical protein
MRIPAVCIMTILLVACVGKDPDLPGVAAPSAPPPTLPGASDLTSVSPATFTAAPDGKATLRVRASRTNGSSVYGVTIVWVVQAGGGTLNPLKSTTDGDGIASTEWTMGHTPGINIATATGGFSTSPVSFSASTFPAESVSVP